MINYFIFFTIIILIFGFFLAYQDRDNLKKISGILTATISLAISVLSFPYFLIENDLLVAIFKAFRYGPSCISMNVNGSIVKDLGVEGRFYHILLYALYILGPIVASVFIITFFRAFNELLLSLFSRHVHVFSKLNERSLAIGESIYQKDSRQTIIYCDSKKLKDDDLKTKARKIHSILLNSECNNIRILKSRQYEFYVVEDDDNCLNSTVKLCDSLLSNRNYSKERIIVRSFVNRKHKDLILSLDKKYEDKIYLRYIDTNSSIAIEAMRKSTDAFIRNKNNNVLIVGEGDFIINLLQNCLTLPNLPNHSQRIDIISPDAKRLANKIKTDSPEILNLNIDSYFSEKENNKANYNVHFYQKTYDELHQILSILNDINVVFVAGNEDLLNYNLSKMIKRFYGSKSNKLIYPEIFCRIKDKEYQKMIEDIDDFVLFGNNADLYNYDYLINPYLEKAAKKTHMAYISLEDLDALDTDFEEKLEETGFYNYTNQESSFSAALSLEYKKAYILNLKDNDEDDDTYIDNWFKNKKNLEMMADSEHGRWLAYERFEGYCHPNKNQLKCIIKKSEGKNAKSNELLLHPAIVENKDLAKTEEYINKLKKEYGSSSEVTYTKTDKIIISNLTKILR